MRFRVKVGEQMPTLWGVAWYSGLTDEAVVLPVPFNLVAGVVVRLWWAAKRGLAPDQVHLALISAHQNLAVAKAYQERNIALNKTVDDLNEGLRVSLHALQTETEQVDELKRQLAQAKEPPKKRIKEMPPKPKALKGAAA